MNVDEERASSPLLGSGSGLDRHDTNLEDDGTESQNIQNGFKDVDDDQVQAEGEDVITSYIWMLVCCASISGLMFGESILYHPIKRSPSFQALIRQCQ
jgi:hypothetical protein